MGVKLDIFNDIITELERVKQIKTTGIWNNQFDNEEREKPFNYPGVFVQFTSIPWTSSHQKPRRDSSVGNVNKEQDANGAIITLHCGFEKLEDATESFADIDAVLELIYFAVHGISGDQYTTLLRAEERQDDDHDRVIDWQIDFITQLTQQGVLDENLTLIDAGTLKTDVTVDLDIDDPVIRTGDGTI